MRAILKSNRIFLALCANGVIGLLIFGVVVWREVKVAISSAAYAQPAPFPSGLPVAGGGMSVMPGQLAPNVFGCYLLDSDHQILDVYEYRPTEGLKLVAARNIKYDQMLENFNTMPSPAEVKELAQPSGVKEH